MALLAKTCIRVQKSSSDLFAIPLKLNIIAWQGTESLLRLSDMLAKTEIQSRPVEHIIYCSSELAGYLDQRSNRSLPGRCFSDWPSCSSPQSPPLILLWIWSAASEYRLETRKLILKCIGIYGYVYDICNHCRHMLRHANPTQENS